MLGAMKATPQQLIAGFAPGERDYIRRELDQFLRPLPKDFRSVYGAAASRPMRRRSRRALEVSLHVD
jgi:hypothetical protein